MQRTVLARNRPVLSNATEGLMSSAFWFDMGLLALIHIFTPLWPYAFTFRIGVTAALAVKYHWLIVIIVADLATVLALAVMYWLCRKARVGNWLEKLQRWPKIYSFAERQRTRMTWFLLALNVTPIPEPFFPLIAVAENYPLGKFLGVMAVGRLVHIVPMVLAGHGILHFFHWCQALLEP